jgi:hypothetical protein
MVHHILIYNLQSFPLSSWPVSKLLHLGQHFKNLPVFFLNLLKIVPQIVLYHHRGDKICAVFMSSCSHARVEVFTVMKFQVAIFWVVTLCSDVVGYQCFGGPCCLHLQVVTLCNDVLGYQRFGEPCCIHLQVVTPFSVVVGYQRFGGLYCIHLQVVTPFNVAVGYQSFGEPCCFHTRAVQTLFTHT